MADVAHIVSDVRARGDDALRDWAVELDGVEPARAVADADGLPVEALRTLADRVRRWHELQRPADVRLEVEPGVELERRWVPLESVGIYVPRGLVSTLVMCAVPAQVAGVERIVVVTPPAGAGLVAAAAELLGVAEVWAVGGPHAIAALAYGTESIAAVDKIVGPWQRLRERGEADRVARRRDRPSGGAVGGARRARRTAATPKPPSARSPPRPSTVQGTVCRIIDGTDLEAALVEIDRTAPEHLVLLGEAAALALRVRNAGAIFVGDYSPVATGDYATGGNHVLPTGGRARSTGGLGLETFLKPVTLQRLTPAGSSSCGRSSRRSPRRRACPPTPKRFAGGARLAAWRSARRSASPATI